MWIMLAELKAAWKWVKWVGKLASCSVFVSEMARKHG